jgi:hypothetical protein
MKNNPASLEYLLQTDIIENIEAHIIQKGWHVLFTEEETQSNRFYIWCALVEERALESCLKNNSWDLLIGNGKPGMSVTFITPDHPVTTYHPYGDDSGVRAFVHARDFHGAFPKYFEMNEEFRLFHNLAYDKSQKKLIDFDTSGYPVDVVHLSDTHIKAHVKYVRQYQAAAQQNLVIFIESLRYSNIQLTETADDIKSDATKIVKWKRYIREADFSEEYKTCSQLMMKVVFRPPTMKQVDIWPFEKVNESQYLHYIIGITDDGENIEYTSNPDKLGDYFGKNPDAPNYVTPVYFRKEVLAKYYTESNRYKVSDGFISCLNLWTCRIDNDNPSHIVVFLGDLGRDLPYNEQLHWKQYNVLPDGELSQTSIRRNFVAEFTDPISVDLVFRNEYTRFINDWKTKHGWSFYLPLHENDQYILDILRIPVTHSPEELDTQVLYLTKLLVDSLNEENITAKLNNISPDSKGITKLDLFLTQHSFGDKKDVIQFLRNLNELRSTGSAHRKGSKYQKVLTQQSFVGKKPSEVMEHLLNNAISCIHSLRKHFIDAHITL